MNLALLLVLTIANILISSVHFILTTTRSKHIITHLLTINRKLGYFTYEFGDKEHSNLGNLMRHMFIYLRIIPDLPVMTVQAYKASLKDKPTDFKVGEEVEVSNYGGITWDKRYYAFTLNGEYYVYDRHLDVGLFATKFKYIRKIEKPISIDVPATIYNPK